VLKVDVLVQISTVSTTAQLAPVISSGTFAEDPESDPLKV
jgi:hypothetical protein